MLLQCRGSKIIVEELMKDSCCFFLFSEIENLTHSNLQTCAKTNAFGSCYSMLDNELSATNIYHLVKCAKTVIIKKNFKSNAQAVHAYCLL